MSNAAAPLVSVLMPVRDGGAWLRPAVESIYAQRFTRFELLLVDDGSTDAVIAQLPGDPRLRIAPNRGTGIVDALNTAVSLARAPLLARMDADDIALPDRLAKQYAYLLANPGVAICGGEVEIFRTDGPLAAGYCAYQSWVNALRSPSRIAREIFIESPLPHPSVMLRRDALDALGGYRDTPWSEDYDLWLRAFEQGLRMGKPAGTVLRWRDSGQRLSRRDPRYSPAQFCAVKAHYLARTHLRERAAIIWGAGRGGTRMHDALAASGVRIHAFVDVDPRKLGGRKRGLPVWSGTQLRARRNGELVLGAVGTRGVRQRLRAELRGWGWGEGSEFLFVA